MLELLKGAPMTAFGVAKALGIPPNQASYQLKVLEREGLASPAGLGRKRWKEERFYRARARAYLVDPGLGVVTPLPHAPQRAAEARSASQPLLGSPSQSAKPCGHAVDTLTASLVLS